MLIYLASPYSHDDPAVREERYQRAFDYVATRMAMGEIIFSPIVYGHQFLGAPTHFEYWADFNDMILLGAGEMRILRLDGWQDSRGIRHEMNLANDNGIRITEVHG